MNDELLIKVEKALEQTGYPLELEIGAKLTQLGWNIFHSVDYEDPFTDTSRELDILCYKLINNRRIELRIACKSSTNKQFVFFTEPHHYLRFGTNIKFTPIIDDNEKQRQIPKILKDLPLFSTKNRIVNYTVLTGDKVDKEGRTILRAAHTEVMNSIYHRLFPYELYFDKRGTIYFFIVLIRGIMFNASFNPSTTKITATYSNYEYWHGKFPLPKEKYKGRTLEIDEQKFSIYDLLHWFGDYMSVEFVNENYIEEYLSIVENCISKLNSEEIQYFGKSWDKENFPENLSKPRKISK
ncbi:MAG: hypothetical protein IH852_10650 [Bacteroidetes bacterium]|nr:hypothetical protein [Bacteroidota bacterium]